MTEEHRVCNGDCWNCRYEGCINISDREIRIQDKFDKDIVRESKPKTPRQVSIERYNKTIKKKKCQQRYLLTEKGGAADLKSRKNYYKNHKQECIDRTKKWYQEHKEEVKKKRMERYYREKELKNA